jgi:hypothetical protein
MQPLTASLAALMLASVQVVVVQPPDTPLQTLTAFRNQGVSHNLVQELKLSDAQTAQLVQIFKEWSAKFDAEKSSGQAHRPSARRFRWLGHEEVRKLKAVLTPLQLTKLMHIMTPQVNAAFVDGGSGGGTGWVLRGP